MTLVGGHPIIAQTLWKQGIRNPQQIKSFLDPDHYTPASPFDLQDMLQAVKLMDQAIKTKEPIAVWGDFDVDGQTSTALLVSALDQLNANVTYHIPVRGKESHGINRGELEKIINGGTKLLITCDTGISEHENIAYARSQNVSVIITDHHQLEASLPPANAVINPNRLSASHPLSSLPGVGVAFKFIEALFSYRKTDISLDQFLDLVALGIIVDVAEITGDTRFLLQKGLKILQHTQRLGLQVLSKRAEIDLNTVDEEIIGFQLGPRMNAVGRLADANSVVELLITNDVGRADIISTNIEGLNIRRKLLVKQVQDAAFKMVEQDPELRHSRGIVLHHPSWPPGVIGIVASHLVDRYNKPVILLTDSGSSARGSARSIEGLNILDAIKSQNQLLTNSGGHPMAAGLSLPIENLPAFRSGFNKYIDSKIKQIDLVPTLEIASTIDFSEITIPFIQDIQRLAPFGRGNPKLNFVCKDVLVNSTQIIGRDQDHRQVVISNTKGESFKALWWNGGSKEPPTGQFDLAFNLFISSFQGKDEITLSWVDTNSQTDFIVAKESKQIIDHRHERNPDDSLKTILLNSSNILIWAENFPPMNYKSVDRYHISLCESLVLWNIPPSQKILSLLISSSKANILHQFANQGSTLSKKEFLKILAGLLKYSLNKQEGLFETPQFVVATVQTEDIVKIGLQWLQEKGLFKFTNVDSQIYLVEVGDQTEGPGLKQISARFDRLWEEFLSYQKFYQTANIEDIFNL
ncbi:MAG: single-stranded-DNA-specific exonuclease RecJ [Anaerolineaceae bacterium]|nr:single-stranded-DNA-specific exonuclease RecJ [Anaerolineaceae bacterium]